MADYLKQITFTISGAWAPPYSLPGSGQAVAIGTNTANSVLLSPHTTTTWAYSLFNNYGGGVYVPDYSSGGAYCMAGGGGHGAPENIDLCLFDFADATWKSFVNGNGVATHPAPYVLGDTSGSPYYEVAAGVPAPAHLYQGSPHYIPTAFGGGTKGSLLLIGQSAVTTGSFAGRAIHKMDLATRVWSRATSATVPWGGGGFVGQEHMSCVDTVANRCYVFQQYLHVEPGTPYWDWASGSIQYQSFSPTSVDTAAVIGSTLFDPVNRIILFVRESTFPLLAIDTQNFSAGWRTLTFTGSGNKPPSANQRWAYYPPDGCFYTRSNDATGNTIHRLRPPANWLTGTWQFETTTVSGASMPNFTDTGSNDNRNHNTCFFYVPSIQCLAWISGETTQVIILRP